MREIDKLYEAKKKLDDDIKTLQDNCSHYQCCIEYVYGIPGRGGNMKICKICDKHIEWVDNIPPLVNMTIDTYNVTDFINLGDGDGSCVLS